MHDEELKQDYAVLHPYKEKLCKVRLSNLRYLCLLAGLHTFITRFKSSHPPYFRCHGNEYIRSVVMDLHVLPAAEDRGGKNLRVTVSVADETEEDSPTNGIRHIL